MATDTTTATTNTSTTFTLDSIPITTLGLMMTCIGVFLYELRVDFQLARVLICPRWILYLKEYYRIITSALFHSTTNPLHIVMNMKYLYDSGSRLERQLGSMKMLITTLWAILLTGFIKVFIAWVAYAWLGYDVLLYHHCIGLSGVLFHFCVLECELARHEEPFRELLGVVTVPSYMYPYVKLMLLQIVLPNVSFIGHLSGVVTGTLQYFGALDILFPSETFLIQIESWEKLSWFVSQPNFVPTPTGEYSMESLTKSLPFLFQGLQHALGMIFHLAWMVLESIGNLIVLFVGCFFLDSQYVKDWKSKEPKKNE